MNKAPITGIDYANRLLENIQTSLAFRATFPDLHELVELHPTTPIETFNTVTNFGTFDSTLRVILTILHVSDNKIQLAPEVRLIRLQPVLDNLKENIDLLSKLSRITVCVNLNLHF
jgi:hypothetical protein